MVYTYKHHRDKPQDIPQTTFIHHIILTDFNWFTMKQEKTKPLFNIWKKHIKKPLPGASIT